jgi:hypothetical protein
MMHGQQNIKLLKISCFSRAGLEKSVSDFLPLLDLTHGVIVGCILNFTFNFTFYSYYTALTSNGKYFW